MKASELFKERPVQWGKRGDPFFWNHLEKVFNEYDYPMDSDDIERIIKSEYKIISGEELTSASMPFVSEYAAGGMSSGILSGEFWSDVAIPLIKNRNTELYKGSKSKTDLSRIGDICFICNTAAIFLLMVFGVLILHILGLELSASIFINAILFFMYAFIEERCISRFINTGVKWLYNRIITSRRM